MTAKRRAARLAGLGVWAVLIGAVATAPGQSDATVSIRDEAGMFGRGAVLRARATLERPARERGVPVVIETVDSLQGQTIGELAERRHEIDHPDAIYLLLAKREHRISDVQVPARLAARVPEPIRRTVREAFLADFKKDDLDEGLVHGAEALAAMLEKLDGAPAPPESKDVGRGRGSLVERDRVRLTLEGARHALKAAEAKAEALGIRENIAVVDDGGHLLAFARMDGARPASAATAITKAVTAATFRQATGPVPADAKPEVQLATSLGLQNAAAASGGKITTLLGGVPIVVDGQVIGALGVGGGTGDQDKDVAAAGANALIEGLKAEKK